jgi:hypothetical protein
MWGEKSEIFGKDSGDGDSVESAFPLWAHIAIGIYVGGFALGLTWLFVGVGLLNAVASRLSH